jgi:hypothetical protein
MNAPEAGAAFCQSAELVMYLVPFYKKDAMTIVPTKVKFTHLEPKLVSQQPVPGRYTDRDAASVDGDLGNSTRQGTIDIAVRFDTFR